MGGPEWGENGYIRLAAHNSMTPEAGTSCLLNPFGSYASLVFPASKAPAPTPEPTPAPTPAPTPLACKYIDPKYTFCCEHGSVAVVCAKGQTCSVLAGLPACLPAEAVVV